MGVTEPGQPQENLLNAKETQAIPSNPKHSVLGT